MKAGSSIIPLEAQYIYRKALEMESLGKYEIALDLLKKVVMVAPNFSKAFFEMGNCLAHLGRSMEAVAKYDKAIRIDPSNRDASNSRDNVIRDTGRQDHMENKGIFF